MICLLRRRRRRRRSISLVLLFLLSLSFLLFLARPSARSRADFSSQILIHAIIRLPRAFTQLLECHETDCLF